MMRGLSEASFPKTTTPSPTAKYFSINGRFHHRQCSRPVPSSRMSSKIDFVCCLNHLTPSATTVPRVMAASSSCIWAIGRKWFKQQDRKSTRLNSSHGYISYAVFCLKKKKTPNKPTYLFTYYD